MFPGFVNIYKDENEFIHLYFFSGIDEDEHPIYKNIDLSKIPFKYSCKENEGSFDYKFENKTIVKINCELVPINEKNQIEKKTLNC